MKACPHFLCCALLIAFPNTLAFGQTVLFDFQNELAEHDYPSTTFGSFGSITTDRGLIPDCNGVSGEVCRFHTGNFTEPVPFLPYWGMVDISPMGATNELLLDLTGYTGYQLDARFVRDIDGTPGTGPPEFTGDAPLEIGLQLDPNDPCDTDSCGEAFAVPVLLTENFQTYSVNFADFVPPGTDLSAVQIKLIVQTGVFDPETGQQLTNFSSGVGRFEYDNIVAFTAPTENADFDGDSDVDGRDFLIWQRGFGVGATLAQGDANNSGSVDGMDLAIWQGQYAGGTLSAFSVPEPGSVALALAAGLTCCLMFGRGGK